MTKTSIPYIQKNQGSIDKNIKENITSINNKKEEERNFQQELKDVIEFYENNITLITSFISEEMENYDVGELAKLLPNNRTYTIYCENDFENISGSPELAKNSVVIEFPKAGHFPFAECQDEYINVLKEIKKRKLKAKIVLQVHDEMMIEVPLKEVEEVKDLLKTGMESACKLNVPLLAEVSEATNWYDCK